MNTFDLKLFIFEGLNRSKNGLKLNSVFEWSHWLNEKWTRILSFAAYCKFYQVLKQNSLNEMLSNNNVMTITSPAIIWSHLTSIYIFKVITTNEGQFLLKPLSPLTFDGYFELLIGCDTYEWHKIYFNSHILFVSNCDRDQLIICFKLDSCHLKSTLNVNNPTASFA